MILPAGHPIHLTYCLNVHRGETWSENLTTIREKTLVVRDRVAGGRPFGLGLRISHQAVLDLQVPGVLDAARNYFKEQNLYAFTINGFPYGRFHADRVKENVYRPDWRTVERRDYTIALAHILAGLLLEGIDGSISTVPCSFKPWITNAGDVDLMVTHLADCAKAFHEIKERAGREIHLGLEPEPNCYLETTEETVRFFNQELFPGGVKKLSAALGCTPQRAEEILRKHIGVCFDTCHVAIQFEDPAESLRRYLAESIRISKIQVSAALSTAANAESFRALEPFCEPVYFHQVKARTGAGNILSWDDLPDALRDAPAHDIEEMRVHFHVPLFFEKHGPLSSTASTLTPAFFDQIREGAAPHIEIETYTFDVLPEPLRKNDVTQSIAMEFDWLLDAFNRAV